MFPVLRIGVRGLHHNLFPGGTPAPVAAHAENHGNTQCWLYRSDVTLITSVQLLNHAIDGPRSHVCWPEFMRWIPVPSATDCKKHALVEPCCTSLRMHSSAVLPEDNADGISCHLFRRICAAQTSSSPEIHASPARQGGFKDLIAPPPTQPGQSATKLFMAEADSG